MSKFIVGQCVRLKSENPYFLEGVPYHINQNIRLASYHILNSKDVERGYYFSGTSDKYSSSFDLDYCETSRPENASYYLFRGSSVNGKSIQPVSPSKFEEVYNDDDLLLNSITTYVIFKGVKTKVIGWLRENMLFFSGMNGEYYKAKTYVNNEGYRVGWGVTLSDKNKKVISNVK